MNLINIYLQYLNLIKNIIFQIKWDDFKKIMEMNLGMTKFDENREKFIQRKSIEDITEDNIVFFVMFFVETYCMEFCKRKEVKKTR